VFGDVCNHTRQKKIGELQFVFITSDYKGNLSQASHRQILLETTDLAVDLEYVKSSSQLKPCDRSRSSYFHESEDSLR